MTKTTKWLLIGLGIITFLLIAILILGAVVRNKVEKELADMDLGDYQITCESVRVNLFRKSLRLNDIRLKTKERRVRSDSISPAPIQYLDAKIGRIIARGISLKALKDKNIDLNTLLIDSPNATIVTRSLPSDTPAMRAGREQGSDSPLTIALGRTEITNGFLFWQQITEKDTAEYRINNLNIRADELRADTTRQSRQQFLYSAQVSGSVGAFRYTFAHGDYILALDSLSWDVVDRSLSAVHAELIPQHPKAQFTQQSHNLSDYMQFNAERLACSGVDFGALWNEKSVRADSIHIPSGYFETYKNRKLNVPERVKPMIHQTIQEVGIPIDVHKIKLDNFNAVYEELATNGYSPGRITFDNIEATLFGFTNLVKHPDQYMEIYAQCQLMKQGELSAVISMPVEAENDHFDVKATLLSTSMPALNPMITPLAQIEIKSGKIPRMDFHLEGNHTTANGNMVLRYNDLDIAVMKVERGSWQQRTGLSDLVNLAVIKSDNPDKNGLRTAQTSVQRDPYRSSFNYIWKGISAGAIESAGTGLARDVLK